MTQAGVGRLFDPAKTQGWISKIEDPGYGKLTLTTLKEVAAAFDVALVVRFAPFGELVDWIATRGVSDLHIPAFSDDPALRSGTDQNASLSVAGTDAMYETHCRTDGAWPHAGSDSN